MNRKEFTSLLIEWRKNFIHERAEPGLSKYIKSQFYENGVKKIDIIRKDTYSLENNFFSSRRSKKNKHNDYGRNISAIMIK